MSKLDRLTNPLVLIGGFLGILWGIPYAEGYTVTIHVRWWHVGLVAGLMLGYAFHWAIFTRTPEGM